MSQKVLTDLNLNQNELQNVVIQNLASAPNNPKAGQHYFNTTDNKEYIYDGTQWTSGGVSYTAGTNMSISGTTISTTAAKVTIRRYS